VSAAPVCVCGRCRTLLKFLAAHRFEGVPDHLQILHIEQVTHTRSVAAMAAAEEAPQRKVAGHAPSQPWARVCVCACVRVGVCACARVCMAGGAVGRQIGA
jgi:hypothetical protein